MRSQRNSPIRNKIFRLAMLSLFIFMILIFKLVWIQTAKANEYRLAAIRQRAKEVKVYPPRGIIYDRNFIPLTNRIRIPTMFVIKDQVIDNEESIEFIMEYTDANRKSITTDNSGKILEFPLKKSLNNKNLPKGIFIAEKTLRYDDRNILSHVIGYVKRSDNSGESGIEKVFDDVLKNNEVGSIYFEIDNKKKMVIPGGGFVVVENEELRKPNSVQLTTDYHIQKIVEEVMDEGNINGAVVVAEVETGDIVAIASRPNFDQDGVDAYLEKDNMEFYNKAIQVSYPPGSLFKIVVLLAALEEDSNIVNEYFYCNGFEKLNDLVIKCNKEEGHGHISAEDAFAKSCNSTFIQMGKRVGSKKIIDMAKKMGYGKKLNIGLLEEVEGNLPEGKELIGPSVGNISIGQGKIEVTPLQVTNMMMILANNGVEKNLSIVKGIVTEDGYMVKEFKKNEEKRVISEENSKIVNKFMGEVVLRGTAKNLDLEDIGGACGKTGSAQAILNGKNTIHGWFSGYYPRENPKYVITVFAEEGFSGSKSAAPIFGKIAREIWIKNR